ncbi:hypothetical protein C2E23DRAFT_752784, partial [Lenzites betulinus]
METLCPHCGALHWLAEKLSHSPVSRPLFGTCCNSGKVHLPLLPDPPLAIRNLFTEQGSQAKEFRENIRQYNSAFAFTSLGVQVDEALNRTGAQAPWVFRIHGELCHRSGSLLPRPGESPVYSQLYIYDPRMALDERARRNSNLRRDTLTRIQRTLLASHQYAPLYRFAYEWLSENASPEYEDIPDVTVRLAVDPTRRRDCRRYNLPTAEDVAVLLPGEGGGDHRDIILHTRAGPLRRIHEGHPGYAPLHYPLLFPLGTSGWHAGLRQRNLDNPESEGAALTQMLFYAYQLQVRRDEFSTILRGG